MANNLPETALFVCFGCMSNVGTLTGLAGLEAIKRAGTDKAGIFCLGGLATEAKSVMEKTAAVKRIVVVDGCPLNCARKIVEKAGFEPTVRINLVDDCGIPKRSGIAYDNAQFHNAVEAILAVL